MLRNSRLDTRHPEPPYLVLSVGSIGGPPTSLTSVLGICRREADRRSDASVMPRDVGSYSHRGVRTAQLDLTDTAVGILVTLDNPTGLLQAKREALIKR